MAEEEPKTEEAREKRDLRDKAVRAAGWTIAAGLAARVLGIVGSLGITYFLDPAAIGDVQIAVILCFTANQFTIFGYGQYIVAKPDEGSGTVWHVTVLHLAMGVLAFLVLNALRSPLEGFFHAPTLGRYLPWMTVAVMFERLYFVPERVLARDMNFRGIAIARSLSELTYTAVSVSLAVMGFGGMSILIGNIARGIVRLGLFMKYTPREAWLAPVPLQKATYKRILRFGLPLGVSQALSFANTRFDNLLMKRLFGSDVMGRYTLAYNLADVPAEQIGEQIADVLLPSFARMNAEDRKRAIVRVTGIIGLVIFPVAVGIGAVALTAERLMRPEWRGIGAMLMVLSVMSVTRPLCSKAHSYLQATDRTIRITQLEGFKLAAVIFCILAFSPLGPLWSCFGVGIAFLLELSAAWFVMARGDQIPFTAFFLQLLPPLMACVPMVAAVEATRRALLTIPVPASLAVQIVVGGVAYAVGALVLARTPTREFLELTRGAIARRRGGKEEAAK